MSFPCRPGNLCRAVTTRLGWHREQGQAALGEWVGAGDTELGAQTVQHVRTGQQEKEPAAG
jgi:hypothetical protein